jgi:hypothetical protein
MAEQNCPSCGRIGVLSAAGCPGCAAAPEERTVVLGEDQHTVLLGRGKTPPVVDGEIEEDQRTVLLTGRPQSRPVESDGEQTVVVAPHLLPPPPAKRKHWGTPPPGQVQPHARPQQTQPPQTRPPLAEGYPEELTTSLTGSLLGAKAAPPRPVPKTSYKLVIPVLVAALMLAIAVGVFVTNVASGAIQDFFDRVITGG